MGTEGKGDRGEREHRGKGEHILKRSREKESQEKETFEDLQDTLSAYTVYTW